MLRVAIVGCGKIADQHVQAIARVAGSRIVGVCDREPLMADQLAGRFAIKAAYESLGEMLREVSPHVVHLTTPPQSHFSLARQCLEAGAHVYLEKPFTVTADEARSLIGIAQACGRAITAGHNYQFTPEMCEMRRRVAEGFLGGPPTHLESHFSYDLGDASYVGPLLGNPNHWVRQLPGKLLHNVVSHGIARLAEFLDGDLDYVIARAAESPTMLQLGGRGVPDELRVLIRDRRGLTAFFCFSTSIKPGINQFRVYGPRNSLWVDLGTGCVVRIPQRSYKSYLTYFVPPLERAREYLRNAGRNVTGFLRQRLYQDFGMHELVRRFYEGIQNGSPPPIPLREIVLTAEIMDEIFRQVHLPPATPKNESASP